MPELSDRILARSEHEKIPALDRLKMRLKALTAPDELQSFNDSEILAPGYARQQNQMAEHVGREKPYGRDQQAEIEYRDVELVEKYRQETQAKKDAQQPQKLRKARQEYTDEFMAARRKFMRKEKADEKKRKKEAESKQKTEPPEDPEKPSNPQREALKKAGEEYQEEFMRARNDFEKHEAERVERERLREEERIAREKEKAAKKQTEAEAEEAARQQALAQATDEYSKELEQGRAQFPKDQERWDRQAHDVDERLRKQKEEKDAKEGEDRRKKEESDAADDLEKQKALQRSRDEYAEELQRGRERFPETQATWQEQQDEINAKLKKQKEEDDARAEAEAEEKRKALREARDGYGDELQKGREQFDQKQQADAERPAVIKTNAAVNSDRNARLLGDAADARQEMRDRVSPNIPPDEHQDEHRGSVYPFTDDESLQITPNSPEFRQLLESRISRTLKENPEAILDPFKEIEGYFQRQNPQYVEDLKQIIGQISEPVSQNVKVMVSIAVAGHQEEASIYESLKSYTHQTLSPSEYEILLFVNWPEQDKQGNPVNPDKTREEIERFRRDYPDVQVRTVQKILPTKDARMGKILKYTHDLALYRHYLRGETAGDAFFVFNDADNKGIDPRYLESIASQFETNKEVDGIRGQLDWDPESYASYPAVHIGTRLFQTLNEIGRSRQTRRLRAQQGVDAVPAGMNAGKLPSSGANFACRASIYAAVGGSAPEKTHGADVLLGKTILMARDNDTTRIQKGSSSTRVYTSARRAVNRFINEGLSPVEQWKDTKSGEGCGAFDTEVRNFQTNTENRIDYNNPEDVARVQEELEYVIDRTLSRYVAGDKTIKDKSSSYFRKALGLLGIRYEVTAENKIHITNMDLVAENLAQYQETAVSYRDIRSGKAEEESPHKKKQNKVFGWVKNIAGNAMSRVRKPKQRTEEPEAVFPLPSPEVQQASLRQAQADYQQEFQAAQENYQEPQLQAADAAMDHEAGEEEDQELPAITSEPAETDADTEHPEVEGDADAAEDEIDDEQETHPEKPAEPATDYEQAVSKFIAQNNIEMRGPELQRFMLYVKTNNSTDIEKAYDDYLKETAPKTRETVETPESGGNPLAESALGMVAMAEQGNPQPKQEPQAQEVTEDMKQILQAGEQNNAEPWYREFLQDTEALKHMEKPGIFRSFSREQMAQFDRIMTNSLDRMSDIPAYESDSGVLLKSASRNIEFAKAICQRNSPARRLLAEKLEDFIRDDFHAMHYMHEYERAVNDNALSLFSVTKRDSSFYKGLLTAFFRNKELHPTELANVLGIPEVRDILKQAVLGMEIRSAQ